MPNIDQLYSTNSGPGALQVYRGWNKEITAQDAIVTKHQGEEVTLYSSLDTVWSERLACAVTELSVHY